mgnify:CR=1 FL=1
MPSYSCALRSKSICSRGSACPRATRAATEGVRLQGGLAGVCGSCERVCACMAGGWQARRQAAIRTQQHASVASSPCISRAERCATSTAPQAHHSGAPAGAPPPASGMPSPPHAACLPSSSSARRGRHARVACTSPRDTCREGARAAPCQQAQGRRTAACGSQQHAQSVTNICPIYQNLSTI